MAIGDVFAIKLHMTYSSEQCRPGFYLVEGTGGGGPSPVRDAIDAVVNALGADPLAGLSEHLSLEAVEGADVQPATSRSRIVVLGTPKVGSVADDNSPPPQDSMLIRFPTAVKRKKGVFATESRMYMPGFASTQQISGFLTTDGLAALDAFAGLLGDAFITDGTAYQMFSVSFTPNTNPRTIQASNAIITWDSQNKVAIQRRRRPGLGL